MRMLARLARFEALPDAQLSRFAATFCWLGAAVTLVLGYRYVGQLQLPPSQHLLGLVVLLILCLAIGALGTLSHIYTMIKSMRDDKTPRLTTPRKTVPFVVSKYPCTISALSTKEFARLLAEFSLGHSPPGAEKFQRPPGLLDYRYCSPLAALRYGCKMTE